MEKKSEKLSDILSKSLSDNVISILMYLAFAAVSVFYGIHLCVPLVLDEVGTIANAAFLAGDDWSICVQSMGGFYYKYGQSLLYLPIYLLLEHDSFKMYKAFMALQMMLVSFVPVISYNILRRYFKIESKIYSVFLACAGAGIPSMWLYTTYARADTMMIFLPWVLMIIILKLSMEDMSGKKFAVYSGLLAFVSVYAYMSHTRGVVLLIATVMTVAIVHIWYKRKMIMYSVYVPATFVLLIIDKMISRYIKHGVYGKYGTQHASLESFDIDTFKKILSVKGILIEMKLVIGWCFNLFASTYGLVIFGIIATAVILLRTVKSREADGKVVFSVFGLLAFLGTFALGALFFFPSAWNFFTAIEIDRADRMMYGRYMVSVVTPICTLALFALTNKKEKIIRIKSKIAAIAVYLVTFVIFIKKICPSLADTHCTNSRYFISLTTFLHIIKSRTNTNFPDLVPAMQKAGILALVIMLIIIAFSFAKNEVIHMGLFAIVFVISFAMMSNTFYNYRNDRDDRIVKRMRKITNCYRQVEGMDKISEEFPCVFRHDSAVLLKLYQYVMTDFNIGKIRYIKDQNQSDYLIISSKKFVGEAINESITTMGESDFYMFEDYGTSIRGRDVFIIRGNKLKQRLEEYGNELIKVDLNNLPVFDN